MRHGSQRTSMRGLWPRSPRHRWRSNSPPTGPHWSRSSSSLWGSPYGFDILLYLAAIMLLFSWRRVRPAHWILFAAFAAASLMAFRNILLIGFLAPILIAAYFPYQLKLSRIFAWATPILLVAAISLGIARGSYFQFRIATWT